MSANFNDDQTLAVFSDNRLALIGYAASIVGDHAHAEDIVQEAWMRFCEVSRQQSFEEPLGFLFRIVRNLSIDLHRRHNREATLFPQSQDDQGSHVISDPISTESAILARDEMRLLLQAMDELPERTRLALEMRRFGGLKLKEIAQRLDISVSLTHELIADGIDHCRQRVRPDP